MGRGGGSSFQCSLYEILAACWVLIGSVVPSFPTQKPIGTVGVRFKLAKVGLEPTDANTLQTNDLQQSQLSSAAQSGAVSVEELLAILATLSPEDRARLAALLSGQAEGEGRS